MTTTQTRRLLTRIAFALLWLYVFTLPFTQATEIPAVGIISKVAGVMAMVGGASAVVVRRQIRMLGTIHMLMAGFVVWSAVTLCWSVSPESTLLRIMTYLQLFVLVLLIWELCVEEKEILQILGAFVLGTIVPALSTLKAFLPGDETLRQRASVAGFNPDALAFMLALSLPAAYYLILKEKSPISALYRLQMSFAVCAILLSGSAITMIAMVIGLSLVCWTFHVVPIRARGNAFVVVMLLGCAATVLIPSSLWKYLAEESQKDTITFASVMNSGVETLHSTPVSGFGAGSADAVINQVTHSKTYFPMLVETGVIGVVCFAVMLGGLFLSAERQSGTSKSFWLTVLGTFSVGVCSANWECSQFAWLMFGLLAAHAASFKQECVTEVKQEQKRTYYVEQNAEVWS